MSPRPSPRPRPASETRASQVASDCRGRANKGRCLRARPAGRENSASHLPGASDARTILINQQAIRRARAMLGEREQASDTVTAVNQGLTDQLLRELLKKLESIDNETRKANCAEGGDRRPGS